MRAAARRARKADAGARLREMGDGRGVGSGPRPRKAGAGAGSGELTHLDRLVDRRASSSAATSSALRAWRRPRFSAPACTPVCLALFVVLTPTIL